jgi:hypothetical protein
MNLEKPFGPVPDEFARLDSRIFDLFRNPGPYADDLHGGETANLIISWGILLKMICPKCQYEQSDNPLECPKCGIFFEKYYKYKKRLETKDITQSAHDDGSGYNILARTIFYIPDKINVFQFWGRALALLIVLIWGWKFILSPLDGKAVLASFMHLVNTPFHEAGHVFFSPFGRVVHSLGGTLGQLLMPAICVVVLLLKTRDTFGASIALWWLAQNFIDIAPYINDARSLTLPLLGGNTGNDSPYGFHDWEFILKELKLLPYDHLFAKISHKSGSVIMIASYIWGAYLLEKQHKNMKSSSL